MAIHGIVANPMMLHDVLNVSWVSQLNEEQGHLFFPIHRYSEKTSDAIQSNVRVAVMHHPLNWYGQSMYRPFRMFIRQLAHILITGHEHQGNIGVNYDVESERSAYVEGRLLQAQNQPSDSSFNIIVLDLAASQFSSTAYSWTGDRYEAIEKESWSDYRELPAKKSNPFQIEKAFEETLDDPGAFLTHSNKANICLADVYVYPDLKSMGIDDRREYTNASMLLRPEFTVNGVLLAGEEKTGRTSLLFQLYREYYDRAFVPLLLNGKDLKRGTDQDIRNAIKRGVETQYGRTQVASFEQLGKERKLLLIDDLDEAQTNSAAARSKLLTYLQKRFAHLVGTVSEMFEIRECIEAAKEQEQGSLLDVYHLQEFNYTRRSELIEKWFSLGADVTTDNGSLLERCDRAERLINLVMQRRLIPAAPLYLLALLQSIDVGRGGDFKDSALGYYYQYLLAEAFQHSGVKSEKLTEVFQYCVHLAWYYHEQDRTELSELELREFNKNFSEAWHTVDFESRLDLLLKSRVLRRSGDDFEFRYPYIYYYFKGQYLSQNLLDLEVRAYIARCCSHLYVRDYANTVLFLAHHTNDPFVLETISSSLKGQFRNHRPVTFDGDSIGVSKFIEQAPKLTYSGRSPEEHRKLRNKVRDDFDDGDDGLKDAEESDVTLSLIAQLAMLFKSVQILGQVLKNQYSKIPRTEKTDLIIDLFNAPLRAMRDFWSFIERVPDAFIGEIEAALRRRGKVKDDETRQKIARLVVATMVEVITLSFIGRAAESTNSESLNEDVHNAVNRNKTHAFRLIELFIVLDSPRALPRQKIRQLKREIKNDLLGTRILQLMVLHRLYMFKTTEGDMQWLANEFSFEMSKTHAIGYSLNPSLPRS